MIEHRTAVGRGVLGGWIYYCTVDGYSDEVYRTKTAAKDAAAAHELSTADCRKR
jgi:hypothetical protein